VDFPYGPAYAALCVLQGALVACPWRRRFRIAHSRLAGVAVPIVVFAVGLAATRGSQWSTRLVADLATFATPVLAAAVGWVWGWRRPWVFAVAAPVAWVAAWRADGLTADVCAVSLIAGACLTLAAAIASLTPRWALALGLVALAGIDTVLVFSDQVRPATEALHAVVPASAGGRPLPALQDATLGHALFGWLDILAPALAATLLADDTRRRLIGAGLTAAAALTLGLVLATSSEVPGTVPPLAAVAVWFAATRSGAASTASWSATEIP